MWVGVPIFFVISGYCIAATADSARRKGTGWKAFAVRRVRRIYPPYWICLGLTVVAVVAVDVVLLPGAVSGAPPLLTRPWWMSGLQWVGNLTLTEVWLSPLLGGERALFLGHAWTLCYEEQFYVVMGLLLLVARRRLFAAAAAVTVACPVVAYALRGAGVTAEGFFFNGYWTLFACGVLAYYALNYASRRGRVLACGVFAAGLAYCLKDLAAFVEQLWDVQSTGHKNDTALFTAAAFALLITAARPLDAWVASRWWLRPLFACGKMCYSLYLVHLPVVLVLAGVARSYGVDPARTSPFVTIPIGVAVSVAASAAFFRLVERRFLNPPQQPAARPAPVSRSASPPGPAVLAAAPAEPAVAQ